MLQNLAIYELIVRTLALTFHFGRDLAALDFDHIQRGIHILLMALLLFLLILRRWNAVDVMIHWCPFLRRAF